MNIDEYFSELIIIPLEKERKYLKKQILTKKIISNKHKEELLNNINKMLNENYKKFFYLQNNKDEKN